MRKGVLLALLIALASSGAVQAIEKGAGVDASAILTQQRQIHDEAISRKGRYKNMEEAKRSDLFTKQDVVFRLLEGKQNSNELAEADRVKLFNALEAIEATVNNERDEQMICEFTRRVGSNRVERVCKTYAQRAKEREVAEKELNRQSACTTVGCS